MPANELICNGGFEQYCFVLDTISDSSWVLPEHAFQFTSLSANPPQQSVQGSDVVNWWPYDPQEQGLTPDFIVRNGIGSPVGFLPFIPSNYNNPVQNWFVSPPSNIRNGTGNAVTHLADQEGVTTQLRTSLLSNKSYTVSGWFYNTNTFCNPQILYFICPPTSVTVEMIVSSNQNGSGSIFTIPVTFSIPHNQNVTGNNGWIFMTAVFSTASIPAGLNWFHIKNDNFPLSGAGLFIDDLSLIELPPANFPQHIQTEDVNDSFHRRIKTDANKNVYVTGKVSNSPQILEFGLPTPNILSVTNTDMSSYIVKYDSLGNLLWYKGYNGFEINDFEIMPNGNLFAVGATNPIPLGIATPPANISWQSIAGQPISCMNNSGTYNGQAYMFNSPCLLIMVVDDITGNVVGMPQAFGDQGYQSGVDVEIIGTKAYIACEVHDIYYELNPGPNACITPPVQSNFIWQANGGFINASMILSYDFNTQAKINFNSYSPSGFRMLDHNGTDLYILTKTKLDKLNILNPILPASNSVNLPLCHSTQEAAKYLHVSQAGDVYLTYPGQRHITAGWNAEMVTTWL